jgi:hypothetical protein
MVTAWLCCGSSAKAGIHKGTRGVPLECLHLAAAGGNRLVLTAGIYNSLRIRATSVQFTLLKY